MKATGYTYAQAHTSRKQRPSVPSEFTSLGIRSVEYGGARRNRRVWALGSGENGLAYWRNRDGWFVPVARITDL